MNKFRPNLKAVALCHWILPVWLPVLGTVATLKNVSPGQSKSWPKMLTPSFLSMSYTLLSAQAALQNQVVWMPGTFLNHVWPVVICIWLGPPRSKRTVALKKTRHLNEIGRAHV